MPAPDYASYVVLGGSVGVIVLVALGLAGGLAAAGWETRERRALVAAALLILAAWLGLAITLARLDVYKGASQRMPTIQFGILVPIAVGALLIWRSSLVARVIDAVPQSWLVGAQIFRVLGGIFLLLYLAGRMPGLFAVPAGLGDVLVGLLAPFVALAYARDPSGSAGWVLAWNVLGIADLVVAVGTGFATASSPLQLAAFDAPNTLIDTYPLVLIPTFLVPIAITLHIASLVKLRRSPERASRAA